MLEERSTKRKKGDRLGAQHTLSNGRLRISPPPLVPEATGNARPTLLRPALILALLTLAGVSYVTGSPTLVAMALICISLVAVFLEVAEFREKSRLASLLDDAASRNRVELEHLADRVWEMEES